MTLPTNKSLYAGKKMELSSEEMAVLKKGHDLSKILDVLAEK
jgi:hypothetical protein